ncbi:hypothetical protein UFOVP449_59 [uncultured Caudovirales phage]|uniref:Uncharacterized protein n=1 Tax=uncultured Caudovirales phage TaxID=2100421 RepID=A0A6J5M7C0_9CAUD|nr:hypothetical protein UFOVP449_59 [uncultured Caudovirales phage]
MNLEKLYDYIFWYNSYEEVWYAVHREYYSDFFGGHRNRTYFIKSNKHSVLVELICKQNSLADFNDSK